MVITFYGEGCFKISARSGQGGETIISTDPIENSSGLPLPRFKSDLILKTISVIQPGLQTENSISGPGEYNIAGADIMGFSLAKESTEKFIKTIYVAEIENIRLCFLGHVAEIPDSVTLEHLGIIDILFIPAGGKPFIDQKSAVKLIKQIQPKIVIPAFFKIPGLKRKTDDVKIFLEEFGLKKEMAGEEKLTIRKKELAEIQKTEIAVLKT